MQSTASSALYDLQELGMASRLLEATDTRRLESVLAALLRRAAARAGLSADADTARALRAGLQRTAMRLGLPHLTTRDARANGVLSRAARLLGIELEGLSPEDKELEIARRVARLVQESLRQLRLTRARGSSAAQLALARAQRQIVPGLAPPIPSPRACQSHCACSDCAGASTPIPDSSERSHAMHDIDQTKAEYEAELDELDELNELDEMETSDEYQEAESDSHEYNEFEHDETGSPFNEVEEAELAQELLGLSNEGELDQFLGSIFKKALRGVKSLHNRFGAITRPLSGMLKGVAKKLLPVAAGAAGTFFGGPVGAAIGSKIGSVVGNALEMEFEGSPEDREFEAAKTFVRLAGTAAKQAAIASPSASPVEAAKSAVIDASRHSLRRLRARRHHSGGYGDYGGCGSGKRSGRWVRRGNRIIIFGV